MISSLIRGVGMLTVVLATAGLGACTTDANGNWTWAQQNDKGMNNGNPGNNSTSGMNGNTPNNNSGMNGVGSTGTTSGLNR